MAKKKEIDFNQLADSIGKYMKKQGWNIVVLSSPSITHEESCDAKYRFNLVFPFVGNRIDKKTK